MAASTMTIQSTQSDIKNPVRFAYNDSKAAAGNGAWVMFPEGVESIGVVLSSTGDGRIEVCFDTDAAINAGTPDAESIVVWDHGNIGVSKKTSVIMKCAAFRQVNISGTTKMYAVAS